MKKKLFFLPLLTLVMLSVQSCFLFTSSAPDNDKPVPSKELHVGDTVKGKTIVWENKSGDSWKFLAMGRASDPMPWTNDRSKVLSASKMSTNMGMGKENTLYLLSEFSSHVYTNMNTAAKYAESKGGWLPSRDEANKMAEFTDKKFWLSDGEMLDKAYYYSPVEQTIRTEKRDHKNSICTIPIYYLDAYGNVVEPY
ncbi:hypothetical protein FUT84_06430 [Treponema phagedenis]|nr:hypothetical protein [Treponema phagedenis]QEJ94942.1 hypothetical protein FUT79_06770 [Treponema phagedenis]QEK00843.1 hypothetical protein FUT84_06430 [Treponema phagedenis]